MQTYHGLIECTPPLSKEEVSYLNLWQNKLEEIYEEKQNKNTEAYSALDSFIGLDLTDGQRWTICHWGHTPYISWSERGLEINGTHKKGQIRGAILSYLHLLIGENPVIRNSLFNELSFLKEHKLNGMIECEKDGTEWLYSIENNAVYSINAHSIDTYKQDPNRYSIESKEDNCLDKLDKYFPPLYSYAKISKELYSKETNNTEKTKKTKI